jgi:hypothetical protein
MSYVYVPSGNVAAMSRSRSEMLRADVNWCAYRKLFGPLIVRVTLSLSAPIWNDSPAAFAVMRPIDSWLSVAANAVNGTVTKRIERESKSRDRTWELIDTPPVFAGRTSSPGWSASSAARYRDWMRNKIVFPPPIGNILKDGFRNRLSTTEENPSGWAFCSTAGSFGA